jgi:hypothetical protein
MPLMEDALLELRYGWLADGDRRVVDAFPDELVTALAAEIGATGEALALRLACWARPAMNSPPAPPAPKGTRDELTRIADALEAAAMLLFYVSPAAKEAIHATMPHYVHDPHELARVSHAARRAAERVGVPKGPPPREDLYELVDGLANVFEAASLRHAGRVWDAYAETDRSIFPDFCRECLEAAGIPYAGSLAGIVQKVVHARKVTCMKE